MTVYLYKESQAEAKLFLGEYSTVHGLKLLPPNTGIQITDFGATAYQNFGWATVENLPRLETVKDAIQFLNTQGTIGLISFEARLKGIGQLVTHDDAQCNFLFRESSVARTILGIAAPNEYRDLIINKLLSHQGVYIYCSARGEIHKFSTFQEYLEKKGSLTECP